MDREEWWAVPKLVPPEGVKEARRREQREKKRGRTIDTTREISRLSAIRRREGHEGSRRRVAFGGVVIG